MKFVKTVLILATLVFAVPASAKDGLDKELKKEKKRLTKKIREMKEAELNDPNYKPRISKFRK